MVTVVAMVGLPALIAGAGYVAAHTGTARIPVAAVLGVAVVLATVVPFRVLGAGWVLSGVTAGVAFVATVAALPAAEHGVLDDRGEETAAVVVDRTVAGRGSTGTRSGSQRYRCTLAHADGTQIRPQLRGNACRELREGATIRVRFDPDGRVAPMPVDVYDRGSMAGPLAVVLAGGVALLVPAAALRGRARRRRISTLS